MKARKARANPNGTEANLGWIPLNLAEYPLALLADAAPEGQKTLEFVDTIFDKSAGKSVTRSVVVTGSDKWGLPNWQDFDVLLALMKLTLEKHDRFERVVQFSFYELRRLLKWPNDGRSKRRLVLAFFRLCGMTIAYKHAWRRENRWASVAAFHPIDQMALTNTQEGFDPEEDQLFKWSDVIVEGMKGGKRDFDWEFYLSLKRPAAKRLYIFLLKRFYLSPFQRFDVAQLCQNKLGMTKYAEGDNRLYKRNLAPAIEELQKRGFLRQQAKEKVFNRVRKGVFEVSFQQASKRKATKVEQQESPLAQELRQIGVKNIASDLVRDYPEEKIRKAIENYSDRIANGENLAVGYLVKDIRSDEGFAFRKGYLSKEEKVKRERARNKRANDLRQREEKERNANERERRKKLEVIASWPKKKRDEFDKAAKRGNHFGVKYYRKAMDDGDVEAQQMYLEMLRISYFDRLVKSGEIKHPG